MSPITAQRTEANADLPARVAAALRGVSAVRLSEYQPSSVIQHLRKRMRGLGFADLADYVQYLEADRSECAEFARELIESSTVFFRDPEAYAGLARVLPYLLLESPTPKIWVPACAAGEDVYSIAMLVSQAQLGSESPEEFTVVGTDVDLELLSEAERGGFGISAAELVPANLRSSYLAINGNECRVSDRLLAYCGFVLHDMLTPPPLQQVDLVDCRNLLSALQVPAQRRAVEQFAAALRPGGILLVGRDDVMASHGDLFDRSVMPKGYFVRRGESPLVVSQAESLPFHDYREALRRSETPGVVLDDAGLVIECNDALIQRLGGRGAVARHVSALFSAGEWARLQQALGTSARAELDLSLALTDQVAQNARVSLTRWETARGLRLIVEWRPTSSSMTLGLPHAPELMRATFDLMSEGAVVIDPLGCVTMLNASAERMTGWTQAEASSLAHESVLRFLGPNAAARAASPAWRCLRDDGVMQLRENCHLLTRTGRRLRVELGCTRLVEGNDIAGALLLFDDVTEQTLLAEELEYRSSHDALTGLANRGEFERQLSLMLTDARNRNSTHWLACIDIDQFKVINDTLGHYAGDEMLRRIAVLLRPLLRAEDMIARLGGDEFGVLLRGIDIAHAKRLIDGLLEAVRAFRFHWEGQSYSTTVSIGVSEINASSESLSRALADADAASFAAKDAGRDRARWLAFGDEELRRRHAEMTMVGRIGKALDEARFVLHYEDVVPTGGPGHVCYRELLVRMRGDDGELVAPGGFIAAAERYYLMTSLDRWVVEHAFDIIGRLPADGVIYAINISGMSLSNDQFLDYVVSCLERYSVAAERICFEITETTAISHLSEAVKFISRLSELGCRFALDDFGVGMASLTYLKTLPVQFVKIDGSFVRAMHKSSVDRSMVEAINRLGHDMGLRTIAEHVEDESTLHALTELGVDWVQGRAIAEGRAFEELLADA